MTPPRPRTLRQATAVAALLAGASAARAQFLVNSTADPGLGTCTVAQCTLRDAFLAANVGAFAHTISFAIPGTGVHTITLASPLPPLTGTVTVDGYTQPGSSPNTLADGTNAIPTIEIVGTNAGAAQCGIELTGQNSVVRGLVLNRFSTTFAVALCLHGDGDAAEGNFIGTNPAGTAAAPNYDGVDVFGAGNHVVGGLTPAARNLLSGNANRGVVVEGSDNAIYGNLIGTNAAGTAKLGNGAGIVFFFPGSGNVVGAALAAGRNVISGNSNAGIIVTSTAPGQTIVGNYIGTDATGTLPLGNTGAGISDSAGGNAIGQLSPNSGNVISGNGTGLSLGGGAGDFVLNNRIGTDASGTQPLGNQFQGIFAFGATDMTVGSPFAGNTIAFNGAAGVFVSVGSTGVRLSSNSIHSNTGLGIDLGTAGVTPNDAGDADNGPNGLTNFPVLTSVTAAGVVGSLDALPSTDYHLEYFGNTECNASGYGEGRTLLGTKDATTDTGGHADASAAFAVPAGQSVTVTATDDAGDTSEFSLCAAAIPTALVVDPAPAAGSDGNAVLEPGESVAVQPAWMNPTVLPLALSGVASNLTGPAGPTYNLLDATSDYGTIAAGATESCTATGDCLAASVSAPATRPAQHWDASFVETMNVATPPKTWLLHVGESFEDIPRAHPFYRLIETIVHNRITVGCDATHYCPGDPVPRSQMALFVARGIARGGANIPPGGTWNGQPYDCSPGGTSLFADVSPTAIYCKAVHFIAAQNVTSGCSPTSYCPDGLVTRSDMAIFVAKGMVAPGGGPAVPTTYGPDPVTGLSYSCDPASPSLHFVDVPATAPYCRHVHYVWARGVVAGCAVDQFCPSPVVGRDAMSKFMTNAFQVRLYGP